MKKGTWIPDCEDQFRTLRALGSRPSRRRTRSFEEFDQGPEDDLFPDCLESFSPD